MIVMQKQCLPKVRKLKNRARNYNLAKSWLDTSHLRHGHLRHISINFLCDIYGKMISDKYRAKHNYPVLEMLSNKIKRLKMGEKSLKIGKKNHEIRHLTTNHPLVLA